MPYRIQGLITAVVDVLISVFAGVLLFIDVSIFTVLGALITIVLQAGRLKRLIQVHHNGDYREYIKWLFKKITKKEKDDT